MCALAVVSDREVFCFRYIPLSWINVPNVTDTIAGPICSFPSLSACDEIEKAASSTLFRCDFGSVEAIAKVCISNFSCILLFFLLLS